MLIAANKSALEAEARAKVLDAEIENLKLTIAKLQPARSSRPDAGRMAVGDHTSWRG